MADWRVVKFNPHTHEVTVRHLETGETTSLVVPPEHRTAEKSTAFIDDQMSRAWPEADEKIVPTLPSSYKYPFFVAIACLVIDICMRLYGK